MRRWNRYQEAVFSVTMKKTIGKQESDLPQSGTITKSLHHTNVSRRARQMRLLVSIENMADLWVPWLNSRNIVFSDASELVFCLAAFSPVAADYLQIGSRIICGLITLSQSGIKIEPVVLSGMKALPESERKLLLLVPSHSIVKSWEKPQKKCCLKKRNSCITRKSENFLFWFRYLRSDHRFASVPDR